MTEKAKKPGPNDVGYCRPPKSGQFPKGKSGNPNGRPKKNLVGPNIDIRDLFIEPVQVSVGGKIKTVSHFEAYHRNIISKAIGGDKSALKFAVDTIIKYEIVAKRPYLPLGYEPIDTSTALARFLLLLEEAEKDEVTN